MKKQFYKVYTPHCPKSSWFSPIDLYGGYLFDGNIKFYPAVHLLYDEKKQHWIAIEVEAA